jgi:hypothetical protein
MDSKYEINSLVIWQKTGLPAILPPKMDTAFRFSKKQYRKAAPKHKRYTPISKMF